MTALREHLFGRRVGADRMFRWRGSEVSRLESLSDGVFALTLTLLVVSVNVAATFYELWHSFRELPAFLVCFVLIMWAWRYHYLRRGRSTGARASRIPAAMNAAAVGAEG